MSLVEIADLRFAWGKNPELLHIPAFTLNAGERVFLHGPSGTGKSTLLALLAGVLLPSQGTIRLDGEDVAHMSASRRDAWRADHLGFVFQQFNLLPWLSVMDNVLLPLRFSTARRSRLDGSPAEEAGRLLTDLKLPSSLWSQPASSLSIGQQQRVAVARALIGRPPLVIADEPTSALDTDTQLAFLDLLFSECKQHGTAVLFVSHDLRLSVRFDRAVALAEINHAAHAVLTGDSAA
ncbi:MAG: ABC transporter ATP-binding protein [Moraxellaceae bacterium]|nr:ABC transporter ATP-binding protein [Moraxellaceae bacterium]